MHLKKALAVIMAASTVASMSVSALAIPMQNTHAVITDDDYFDPVWVELTDENSTYDTEDHQRYLNDDVLKEGQIIDDYESYYGEDLSVIGDEITDVADLTVGETYDFLEGNGIKKGDVISGAVEGGAELTYLGEGKDTTVTEDVEYQTALTPVQALLEDISSIESGFEMNELTKKVKNNQFSDEDAAIYSIKQNMMYQGISPEEIEGLNLDELAAKQAEITYRRYYGSDEEECRQYIAENKDIIKADAMDEGQYYIEMLKNRNIMSDTTLYEQKLAELKAVLPQDIENPTDAEIEAICQMYGLSAEEIGYMTKNRGGSHMILMPNSGFVNVEKAGKGFDECEQGMLEYFEGRGWMYGCTGGGVAFGAAESLRLVNIERKEIPANAYTVIPVNAIQLNSDGYGIVQLKDVKAQFEIDGEMYDIKSFEFLDEYVGIDAGRTDVHATVFIGGRPFTLTFNLIAWKENPTKPVPVEIVPVKDEPQSAPVVTKAPTNKFVEKAVAIGTDGATIKTTAQKWFGYDYTNKVIEKKPVAEQDVTRYLNECISGGKEYITFAPSGMDTAGITTLGTALASVSNKGKVKGLDFSEVDVNPNCDLTGALAGYTNLDTLIISNWSNFNQTIVQSGLVGTGEKVYYYNSLTNPEYNKYLDSLGWTGFKVDIDVSNKAKLSDAWMQWAAAAQPQKFIFNGATSVDIFNYLVGLGWTPIVAE